MSPESVAKTWLDYARKDFELASIESPPEGVLDLLCFHAQQAAEKALKAVLILHSGAAPRTHDIAILLERIEAFSVIPPVFGGPAGSMSTPSGPDIPATLSRFWKRNIERRSALRAKFLPGPQFSLKPNRHRKSA